MYRFYKPIANTHTQEECFYIESEVELSADELLKVQEVLADGFDSANIKDHSIFKEQEKVVEIGPRLNFATAFSTNAVAILNSIGLSGVTRVEKSMRQVLTAGADEAKYAQEHADKMTQMRYEQPLKSFAIDINPEKVYEVKLIEDGPGALRQINDELGLGMDDWDINFYYELFTKDIKRNPTNVECFQLGQANSEHSRHWFFKGKLIIDGENIDETLFDIVRAPYEANKANSVIAFSDNSSALRGHKVATLIPKHRGETSLFEKVNVDMDSTLTAETHNFPTGVAPRPGAETGSGGRIRDNQSTGRGAHVVAGTAGYCVGNLQIPGYELPWEDANAEYPSNLASPLKIEIDASNGASDYGNKFGEPLIQGFARSFGQRLPGGERREWLKPIMFTGGVGHIDHAHLEKGAPEKGMKIVAIGGPMYRIGVGGGAASSVISGENKEELDFNAVQRGDAEMEQKMNRVVRGCVEMGQHNPIISIHDQGAGGPCNVLTEITEPAGGKIEIRNINIGDKTLSVLEIWSAEAQERNALLIHEDRLKEFKELCKREKSMYEVLGDITGDGKIILTDKETATYPVNLELEKILGKMPQKTFEDTTQDIATKPLEVPENMSLRDALKRVLKVLAVGSKRYLVTKVDRSVTGLVAAQQCVGPMQLPVADVSIVARSLESNTSATAVSIGEQPIKALVNPEAGARMSVGEAITNIMWAGISRLENIKCSANWMWAAKLPGEASNLHKAAVAMSNIMLRLGIAIDGGKDSLSMAAHAGDEVVKSPGELTISAYADMPNVKTHITPDIKSPGESSLWFVDIAAGKHRLGGSALAQVLSQVGDESPDVDDAQLLTNVFNTVQRMIKESVIVAGHDRSDGGLVTTVLEMAFAGNCGFDIKAEADDPLAFWLNEELGVVVEVPNKNHKKFTKLIEQSGLDDITIRLGATTKSQQIIIHKNGTVLIDEEMQKLRGLWEETSHQLNALQTNKECAEEEKENIYDQKNPVYKVINKAYEAREVVPLVTAVKRGGTSLLKRMFGTKHKIAIIREEGSNGDREMAGAFHSAGFTVHDVTMTDLLEEKVKLKDYRGIAFVGGFSYADTLGSAKGWASTIKFNENLKKEFNDFYNRKDTFSFGVCNGCQLMAHLGWIPGDNIGDVQLVQNNSQRFESRWATLKIEKSPSIMLNGLEGSILGCWVAHGEGKFELGSDAVARKIYEKNLTTVSYIDDNGKVTEQYPHNPNGSPFGIAGLVSEDGRHLAIMPHPERAFLKWQWPYMSKENDKEWKESPWLQIFINARKWCDEN